MTGPGSGGGSPVGAWRLRSYTTLTEAEAEANADGRAEGPLGPRPVGRLVYTADGHVSVSMMRTGEPPPAPAPGVETFMGYAGTWRISGSRILHRVAVSAHPHQVDTELVREFQLAGDILTLRGTAVVNGCPVRRELVWERMRRESPHTTYSRGEAEAMKALVAPGYVPVEELETVELPQPEPAPGELLLQVRAAGLNPLDLKLATGAMREVMPVEHPFTLGVDAAGTVRAVGAGVTRFQPGDEVVALTFPRGAVAEYTVVADGPTVVPRPPELSAARAAALPTPGLMAAALHTALPPKEGQNVLLVGADGAVAGLFLQLAAGSGARVLGTARPETAAAVRARGVTDVLDFTAGDPVEEALRLVPGGVDVAIDLVNAGPGLARTAEAVRPGGVLASALGGPPQFDRDVSARYLGVEEGFERFAELAGAAAAGTLSYDVAEYPFGDVSSALGDFAARRTRDRVVVTF